MSTSNDSKNWYRKVSVRSGMFGENVKKRGLLILKIHSRLSTK